MCENIVFNVIFGQTLRTDVLTFQHSTPREAVHTPVAASYSSPVVECMSGSQNEVALFYREECSNAQQQVTRTLG
jgi:hypothetical protein